MMSSGKNSRYTVQRFEHLGSVYVRATINDKSDVNETMLFNVSAYIRTTTRVKFLNRTTTKATINESFIFLSNMDVDIFISEIYLKLQKK